MTTRTFRSLGLILITIIFAGHTIQADDIRGYMVPEYYTVISHNSGSQEGIEGQHGFWLRRVFFGYNTRLSDKLSARLRLEMNSPAFGEGYATPYVKNAHLKYQLAENTSITVGIMDPPSFNKIDKFWGYRFLEKVSADLFGLASSRDFGIMLDGKTRGGLVYSLMYGNYGSNKGEDNKGKGFYARIGYESQSFYVEANGHFAKDRQDDLTYLASFAGLKGGFGRAGIAYYYKNRSPQEGQRQDTSVISAFGFYNISKKIEAYLRYDHFTRENLMDIDGYLPMPASEAPPRLLIAGVTVKLHKMVMITPNIKYVFYGNPASGEKPSADFYFNLTAKISFLTKLGKE